MTRCEKPNRVANNRKSPGAKRSYWPQFRTTVKNDTQQLLTGDRQKVHSNPFESRNWEAWSAVADAVGGCRTDVTVLLNMYAIQCSMLGLYYAPHSPVELRQFVGSYQSPRTLEKSSQDGLQILPRSSSQDGLNCPSKFQRHVSMSYDVFPALVTRKVTQNNGRYAPKVTQKRSICAKSDTKWDTKSKSDVYRLAQYNTDFRRAAQARRLRLAGHIWTQ